MDIDTIWQRIQRLQGIELSTKTGKPFTIEIDGNLLTPSRTDYQISKADFAKALELVPLDGPGKINELVRGPAYVWAILHHPAVRVDDW